MEVGDIVFVNHAFLGSHPQEGFVYEKYNIGSDKPGVSVILKDGNDLGGFSQQEQTDYLEFKRKSGLTYSFKNVLQLDKDFRDGYFTKAFGD
jgi:hypothetical protein